ncbi:MAG TPA: DNA-3-methyladenine glycosylase [Patescibacteria group bacterium]|nr:DNA-3-methyladenine glycosylase [Patescibacteria group bacterium]
MNDFSWLKGNADEIAPRLLGCVLERIIDGKSISGKIVEVEAYDQSDSASHSYRGKTARTEIMFGAPGHLYVYFTYGMHYCCNIVVGPSGHGSAVLIRAIEPIGGLETMATKRGGKVGQELTNGPAKLCQALGIDKALNGHDLHKKPLQLKVGKQIPKGQIVQTTRIGIRHATDTPWRFYIKDNVYVSKAKMFTLQKNPLVANVERAIMLDA